MIKRIKENRNVLSFSSLIILALLISACSPETTASAPAVAEPEVSVAEDSMSEEIAADGMMTEEAQNDMAMDDDESMVDDDHDDMAMDGDESLAEEDEVMMDSTLAIWQKLPLIDAATGESYTLADFKGKTVYVEPMATWCTNCRRQLNNVQQAINSLGAQEEIIFIALSLETNLPPGDLTNYAANEGFSMKFSIMSEDFLMALVDQFGRSAANAPSTPHFVIRPDGTFTDLSTGFENAEAVIDFINSNSG